MWARLRKGSATKRPKNKIEGIKEASAPSTVSVIVRPDNQLCTQCEKLCIPFHRFDCNSHESEILNGHDLDTHSLVAKNIGFLDDIYGRKADCPFCRLVFEATYDERIRNIRMSGFDRYSDRVSCWLNWELDGRYAEPWGQGGPMTRRLRIFSKTNVFQPGYLVPVQRDLRQSPTFQARPIHAGQIALHQVLEWMQLCERHHKKCSNPYEQFTDLMVLRVIDVKSMRIILIDSSQKYYTLSYCWGGRQAVTLTTSNYLQLTTEGIKSDELPETISDAIQLTSALGGSYIWIDSLCIIQDSQEDWNSIAPIMDRIYGKSNLTICAGSGRNSKFGLPGSKLNSRTFPQPIYDCAGVELVAFRALEDRIKVSPWNSRAWTFQERVLSQRCLIFVDDRVFFQCREATWSEELNCESTLPVWTLDAIHSPLKLLSENPLRRYAKSVELYSGRELSFIADRLIAFEGILLSLSSDLPTSENCATFQYGLPACYFDWALLWEPQIYSLRITPVEAGRVVLPSWSWCGWYNTSEWRAATTSSILLDLHGWLMNHTWIIWYIGKGSRHQLVYESSRNPESTHRGRWNGYGRAETDADPTTSDGRIVQDALGRSTLDRKFLEDKPNQSPREGHLHFFSWSAHFKLSAQDKRREVLGSIDGTYRFDLLDCQSDWCGTVTLNVEYMGRIGEKFEFIAISDAREFAPEECDSWTYYVPEDREEADWYLYYAVMIVWNEDKSVAERVGLAKIYKAAFSARSREPGVCWKEITLG